MFINIDELTDRQRIDLYYQIKNFYTNEDIDALIEDNLPEAIVLKKQDRKKVIEIYNDIDSWENSARASLEYAIENVLDENFSETKHIYIRFFNKDLKDSVSQGEDETDFYADNLRQLGDFWLEFAKENNLKSDCFEYYEFDN